MSNVVLLPPEIVLDGAELIEKLTASEIVIYGEKKPPIFSVDPPKFSIVKVRVTDPLTIYTFPKLVPSAGFGVVSLSKIVLLKPVTLISGPEGAHAAPPLVTEK